jgi:predicted RNA binding protein YcfA (HicA-like mRNA interferase family)
MSKLEKLITKLKNETISASELRTLLSQLGWVLDRTRGSHEYWKKQNHLIVLATHIKELPRYQMKQVKEKLEV